MTTSTHRPSHSSRGQVLPEEMVELQELALGNVTTFTADEAKHPIHFFEQVLSATTLGVRSSPLRVPAVAATPTRPWHPSPLQARRCYRCGRQLFVIFSRCSCEDVTRIHDDVLPPAHLELLTEAGGISKPSRALNEMVRLCELALPAGTHRCGVPIRAPFLVCVFADAQPPSRRRC